MPRFWGQNIVIDGSWYTSPGAAGATIPPAIKAQGVAPNSVVEGYEYRVQRVLQTIAPSTVGGLLITLINASARSLRIVPVGSNQFGETQAVPVACFPKACAHGVTDSVIWFEPTAWSNVPTAKIDPNGRIKAEDVLVHEMFHALREMRGLFNGTAAMGDGYGFVEEYYSTLVTNMYVSEVGRPESRRGDHALVFHPLKGKPPGLISDTAYDFYTSHSAQMDAMINQMQDFCVPLGESKLDWNPIRVAKYDYIYAPPGSIRK